MLYQSICYAITRARIQKNNRTCGHQNVFKSTPWVLDPADVAPAPLPCLKKATSIFPANSRTAVFVAATWIRHPENRLERVRPPRMYSPWNFLQEQSTKQPNLFPRGCRISKHFLSGLFFPPPANNLVYCTIMATLLPWHEFVYFSTKRLWYERGEIFGSCGWNDGVHGGGLNEWGRPNRFRLQISDKLYLFTLYSTSMPRLAPRWSWKWQRDTNRGLWLSKNRHLIRTWCMREPAEETSE